MPKSIRRAACWLFAPLTLAVAVTLLASNAASALTTFYVDPDWTGAQTGAATDPWDSLTSSAWATINATLASDDVIVYFSARQAGSDTNQLTTAALNVYRTDASPHRLTLDGQSEYNQNDTSPSWAPYSGTHQFQITASVPVSTAYAPSSNVTIHGFRLIATGGQIIFWYGGDNIVWENNEGSASASNTWGPGFYFGYTEYDYYYGGSTCSTVGPRSVESCVAYNNLIIRGNNIHDTFGEGIYIGGCGDNPGCLSHNGVTIENNTVGPNIAVWGGEPDAIDLKDGLRNVVVNHNTVVLQRDSRSGVSTESGALVERNYIESAGWAGIAFSVYWNNSGATRAGSVARNNIIVNSGGNLTATYGTRYGIYTDAGSGASTGGSNDQYTDLQLYNNTIYKVNGPNGREAWGISVVCPGATLINNIVDNAQTYQLYAPSTVPFTHSNNLFYSSTPGATVVLDGSAYTDATVTNFEASAIGADPQFVSTSTPYAPGNFSLRWSSPAHSTGIVISSFNDDYFGNPRGTVWDRGAIQRQHKR